MTRKCYTLETNPQHHEEESQNINHHDHVSKKTIKVKQPALSLSLYLSLYHNEMIGKLEMDTKCRMTKHWPNTTPTKMNQQQKNHRLRTDISRNHWGGGGGGGGSNVFTPNYVVVKTNSVSSHRLLNLCNV